MRIKAIMQDVRVAPRSPSRKVCRVSEPVKAESPRESTTPTAAASIGEAQPT